MDLRLPKSSSYIFDRRNGILNVLRASRYRFWVFLPLDRSNHRVLWTSMVI